MLTHAVSNQPVCSPYRAMLFSGQYPFSNGVWANCNTSRDHELSDDTQCFSDTLSENGYATGYIGKLHLHKPRPPYEHGEGPRGDGIVWDAYTPPGPSRHGFDFWHSYGCCDEHMQPHYWTTDSPVSEPLDPNEWSVIHETDVATKYIQNLNGTQRDPDKPYFLMVSYNPPHPPLDQVPSHLTEPFVDKSLRELLTRPNIQVEGIEEQARTNAVLYFAAIYGIDQQFARILAAIDESGQSDNTIVIFTSDHGELLHSHGLRQKNYWYDESMLVPFLIRYPGKIQPGEDDLLLGAPDIFPTVAGLVGLSEAIPESVEGQDYSAQLMGTPEGRPDSAYFIWPHWRHHETKPYRACRGVRTHRYTYVLGRCDDGSEEQILHDSQEDPFQMRNVADDNPGTVSDLRGMTNEWIEKTNDPWLDADLTAPPA